MRLYDVLVVGSGASGGWVAKELTERGMQVCMLEAGPPRVPTRDFTEHVWPYQLKFCGFGDQRAQLEDQPVQRLCYACDEYSHQFFVNDHEHPYTFPAEKPFMWIRGRQVGGKTFCWARESYRYTDYEFKAASRDGYEQDWPFSYRDLEPYYDQVESFIGVSGSREGLDAMPDGKFLPPMRLSCGALLAKHIIEKKFGWRVMPDRVANLTVPHNGRPACHYCNECQRGCYTASYFNSPAVTLPAAARTGRFTLISDAVVSHLLMNDEGKAEGVYYIERTTRAEREARQDRGAGRLGSRIHAHPAELDVAPLSQWRGQFEWRPRPLPDGPLHPGRSRRHPAHSPILQARANRQPGGLPDPQSRERGIENQQELSAGLPL